MNKDLLARGQQSENSFNELVKLKDEVDIRLKAFGLSSYAEIDMELARLQGEYRLVQDLVKPKAPKVSPAADTIDVEAANAK